MKATKSSNSNKNSQVKQPTAGREIVPVRGFLYLLICLGAFGLLVDVYLLIGGSERAEAVLSLPSSARNPVNEDSKKTNNNQVDSSSSRASKIYSANITNEQSREYVAFLLRNKAGVEVDAKITAKLPTLQQVAEQYGPKPVILGLERCQQFRDQVPEVKRMLGSAGMFSTGTNLVTHLLKQNCYIPARAEKYGFNASKEELGMRWQVPWGKHTPASYKNKHSAERATVIAKDDALPIVTIRNPWRWMQSMCKNPYTAKWRKIRTCPNLIIAKDGDPNQLAWNPVVVRYGAGSENYTSLVHLWLDWYGQYIEKTTYPRLIVRIEDLVFYTEDTVTQICDCAGGVIRTDRPFKYITESAKGDSPGHDTSIGLTQAWIKYSQPLQPKAGFVPSDYQAALDALMQEDHGWMKLLHYLHPVAER